MIIDLTNLPSYSNLVSVGALDITWYSLAYPLGLLFVWYYCYRLAGQYALPITQVQIDLLMVFVCAGLLIGGKGFYELAYRDFEVQTVDWAIIQRGMSFHGALVGIALFVFVYSKASGCRFWSLTDMLSFGVPVGLFLGRVGNFVNGEHIGRPTDGDWGVIVEANNAVLRHPSQIYEAITQGPLLFLMLYLSCKSRFVQFGNGGVTALFLVYYGFLRFIVEYYREPEVDLNFLPMEMTFGQLLSVLMILVGIVSFGLLKLGATAQLRQKSREVPERGKNGTACQK